MCACVCVCGYTGPNQKGRAGSSKIIPGYLRSSEVFTEHFFVENILSRSWKISKELFFPN